MQIKVDDKIVFELSETQKKIICNDISMDDFQEEMERRARYIFEHKYEQCMKRLRDEWMPKFKESGMEAYPVDDEVFAEVVFRQRNYKDRKARDALNKV